MSNAHRMSDWFRKHYGQEGPFGEEGESAEPEGASADFEFTLTFPQPPDNILQSVRVVDGRLIISFEFVFDDPQVLEESGESEDENYDS